MNPSLRIRLRSPEATQKLVVKGLVVPGAEPPTINDPASSREDKPKKLGGGRKVTWWRKATLSAVEACEEKTAERVRLGVAKSAFP